MTARPLAVVVLAAGLGTRMKSDLPKVLHPVAGRPMVLHVLDVAQALGATRTVAVLGPGMAAVAEAIAPVETAVQADRRGTGHAVQVAWAHLGAWDGDVLVLFGDTPLVTAEACADLLAARGRDDAAVATLGFQPDDPTGYGRLVVEAGQLTAIVEEKDADAEIKRIGLVNGGLMAFDGARLGDLLARLSDANAQGEFYLTDTVAHAKDLGWCRAVAATDPVTIMGVNNRVQLAAAEAAMQDRLRASAMLNGATLVGPETVFLSWDTTLGRDVVIGPHVVVGPGVTVGDESEIRAFSHLEGATVSAGAQVGPYARLRPGTDVGRGARVGNFVEVKNAVLEAGAKIAHLSYIGDATVGAEANVGAGTITCNYDGFAKHRTTIGPGAFIGSNSALVAPVTVGADAIVGAGSTITRDVPADALAVARGAQKTRESAAKRLRDLKSKQKG